MICPKCGRQIEGSQPICLYCQEKLSLDSYSGETLNNFFVKIISIILITIGFLTTLYSFYIFIVTAFFGGLDHMAWFGWVIMAFSQVALCFFILILGLTLSKFIQRLKIFISVSVIILGLIFFSAPFKISLLNPNASEVSLIFRLIGIFLLIQFILLLKNRFRAVQYVSFAIIYFLIYLFLFLTSLQDTLPLLVGHLPNVLVGKLLGVGAAGYGESQTLFVLLLKNLGYFSFAQPMIWIGGLLLFANGIFSYYFQNQSTFFKKYCLVIIGLVFPFLGFFGDMAMFRYISPKTEAINYLEQEASQKIVYQADDINNIWLVDINNPKEQKQLTKNSSNVQDYRLMSGSLPQISEFKNSPLQNKVAYIQRKKTDLKKYEKEMNENRLYDEDSEIQNIYLIDMENKSQEKVLDEFPDRYRKNIIWSFDNSKIAFFERERILKVGTRPDNRGIYGVNKEILGKKYVVRESEGFRGVGIYNLKKKETKYYPIENLEDVFTFSKDNQKIYGIVTVGERKSDIAGEKIDAVIIEIDVTTGNVKKLSTKGIYTISGSQTPTLFLTEDGGFLVFDNLIVFNLKDESQYQLPEYRKKEEYEDNNPNHWSFNLQQVAYPSKDDNLVIADSHNKNIVIFKKQPHPRFRSITSKPKFYYWLSDNKRFIFELIDKLWVGDINGNKRELVDIEEAK